MVGPEPTRMRTTGFTLVTTTKVTGATVDRCFFLVRAYQHGIAFQLLSCEQRSTRTSSENCFKAKLPSHACGSLVGVCQTYLRQCVQKEDPNRGPGQTVELSSGGFFFLLSNFYVAILTPTLTLSLNLIMHASNVTYQAVLPSDWPDFSYSCSSNPVGTSIS